MLRLIIGSLLCAGSEATDINPYGPEIMKKAAYDARPSCAKDFNECGVSCMSGVYTTGNRKGEKYLQIHHNTLYSSLNPQAPLPHLQHPTLRRHKCAIVDGAPCGCQCTCLGDGDKPHCVGPHCPHEWGGGSVGASIKLDFVFPSEDATTFDEAKQDKLRQAIATLFGLPASSVIIEIINSLTRRLSEASLEIAVFIRVPDLDIKEMAVAIIENPSFGTLVVEECDTQGLQVPVPEVAPPEVIAAKPTHQPTPTPTPSPTPAPTLTPTPTPCGPGQYLPTGGSCAPCPLNTFNTDGQGHCLEQQVCGASQEPTGRTPASHGSCKNCVDGFFSDSIGHGACVAQPVCSPGQYLTGGSTAVQGTCTACPSGTYNEDGQGLCDWHGECPAGYEPSGLSSKSAKSQCVQCPPGTYSSSRSSQEMCRPWASCSSNQALIEESPTNPGHCLTSCHDHYTPTNYMGPGWGGDTIYLDRHNVQCPAHQILGAMGMTRFKLERTSSSHIRYAYRCCDADTNSNSAGSVSIRETPCNYSGGGRNTWYLDRHQIHCTDGAIKSFKLQSCNYHNYKYKFQCVKRANRQCEMRTTRCNELWWSNDNLIYLDRHDVQCPSNKPFMKQTRLRRCGHNRAHYQYECCA